MINGWGEFPRGLSNRVCAYKNLNDFRPYNIPFANLRSYGDEAMAVKNGQHVDMNGLDHLIDFNEQTGILTLESGVTLKTILDIFAPRGWFLPCVPGTAFISVGGAIANDVHGKNHASVGCFGDNIDALELVRSDGTFEWISDKNNKELYRATIGGLGLTGFITKAKIKLRRIDSSFFNVKCFKYSSIDSFFELNQKHKGAYEYNVAWVDCLAPNKELGRGHFIVANHASDNTLSAPSTKTLSVPIKLPFPMVNGLSVRAFNTLYYHRQRALEKSYRDHYQNYLFPLDSIQHWNRIYGKKGFVQHQSVIPTHHAPDAIALMLRTIKKNNSGSFLAVLKEFGARNGKGLLSFARPGITLALDFTATERNLNLLTELDDIVEDHEGAIYLAKDARSSQSTFEKGYPNFKEFKQWIDPTMASLLSHRIGLTE